jgi:hypothetical protein
VDECSSTFVITSAPAVVPSKPADVVIPFCQVTTQESLAQQFAAWLAQFGATGGCDPQVQLSAHGDPGTCGGDPITVTATITDKCLATPIVVSATFEVVRPLAPFISERSDVRILACTTQAEIHTRWLDFLASVTAGSECGPLVVTPQPSGAEPDRCAGGDVLVTWVANPNCFPPLMRTARFIVDPAPEPQIQCVAGRDLDCNPVGLPDLPPTVTSLCAYVLTHEDGPVLGEPCAREQIRTWRVTTDCYPNGVTCTQRFTWKESTGPTLLCAPNETIACNTTPVFTPPTVSGGCAEVILSGPVITVVGNVHTATWTATDACGITSAPCSQSITVEQCLLNGCTLGYWKNHTQAWSCEGIQTCTLYGTVFTGAPANLANLTLLEVLNLKGNTNCENLGRQSVAALLNICEGLPYGIPTQGELITLVNTAFAENNCLNIGALLDGYNNEGGDNHCDVEFSPNDKTDQCNGAGARVKGVNKKVSNASGLESVKAYPNPFTNAFSLDVRPLTNPDQLHMSIYDMRGRSIEQIYFNPEETNSLQFGDGLPTGIYNVILNQATEVKTLRVIKQ